MHIESVFMSGGYNAEHRSNEAKIIFMLALRRKIIPQTAKTKVKAKATGERIYIRDAGTGRIIIQTPSRQHTITHLVISVLKRSAFAPGEKE